VLGSDLDEETLSILNSSKWELGQPQNELATAAHSGGNAWGTNLRGEPNDFAKSDLISPAIELLGGNVATLRFWHSYDFFPRSDEGDLLEVGGLYITTNNGAVWTPLTAYDEASDGWVEEEVDLTPYVGKVIRLGWVYELFSIDAVVHPGWLLDDVSVTVTNVVLGAVQVTNNLAQASFTLAGPMNRNGQGFVSSYTNAPPGDYVVTFRDVPFYTTPVPQTNSLAQGGAIDFEGRYLYTDANTNGLSDAWETQYFGAATPGRNSLLDTDGDGVTDLGEFLSGTDPTEFASTLQVSQPVVNASGAMRLDWPSSIGFAYRVETSSNLLSWEPLSGWLRATRTNATFTVPPRTNAGPALFRLQVKP
jgi:hypothetical protein